MSKTVLITGASGDIGRAIAKAFSAHSLVLQYHKADPSFGAAFPTAKILPCDLRQEAQVAALFQQAGPVDVLINCCGVSAFSQFQDITLAAWNELLAVNVTSAFLCCRAALPNMLQKKAGAIVNIGSIWGETGASCEVHYSASKGALSAMTRALAKEVAPSGIRVNCVSPGFIHTKMNAHLTQAERAAFFADIPMGRPGTPEEVAQAVAFLALSATYITAQTLTVSGGY